MRGDGIPDFERRRLIPITIVSWLLLLVTVTAEPLLESSLLRGGIIETNNNSLEDTPPAKGSEDAIIKYYVENYYKAATYQPRHVHIAYTGIPTEMMITWSTTDKTQRSSVEYGLQRTEELVSNGSSTLFVEQGSLKLQQYIHRVKLTNLIPGQIYLYHCGSERGWSEIFFFTAMKRGQDDWSPRLAVYGDLGAAQASSLTQLQEEVQNGVYDAVLHVGDMGYNLDSNDGLVGDAFMDEIQPIAAYVPYMTCPGNHEEAGNFTQYRNRFSMPSFQAYESMMYSWNMGPIHFICLSTPWYFFSEYGIQQVFNQFQWLHNDLVEATKPENRRIRPWIITYGHRPMYCSNEEHGCQTNDSPVRIGLPALHIPGLEETLIKYGVDLAIWAHEHSYERLFPLYNKTVHNGSYAEPYRNPKGLTHIITGSAGSQASQDNFSGTRPPWSAFRTLDHGYSRIKAINYTHLYLEQVSIDQGGRVIDSFHLIREEHSQYGPFPHPPFTHHDATTTFKPSFTML